MRLVCAILAAIPSERKLARLMFDLQVLALSIISLVLIELLGIMIAKKPVPVREYARIRRKR